MTEPIHRWIREHVEALVKERIAQIVGKRGAPLGESAARHNAIRELVEDRALPFDRSHDARTPLAHYITRTHAQLTPEEQEGIMDAIAAEYEGHLRELERGPDLIKQEPTQTEVEEAVAGVGSEMASSVFKAWELLHSDRKQAYARAVSVHANAGDPKWCAPEAAERVKAIAKRIMDCATP